MSGGHLEIEVLPAGSIVPAFETLDAVHKKVLDGGHTAAAFWVGRNRAAVLFGSTPGGPFGMDVMDYLGLNRNEPWSKAMYRLLSATPSPYARKVRIALAEKSIPFELITEVPWDSDTSTPQYNPLEKLPVLICDDGTSVYESRYILEWLELKHPTPRLTPEDVDGVLAVKRFEVLADGICDAGVLLFWERARAPEKRSVEWAARQQRKVEGGLRELSRLLGEREYCVGDKFTLADIAVGSLLRWLDIRMEDNPWRRLHPNLAALSDRLEERPSFRNTVPFAQTFRDKVI